jgi:GGDEF domain-containing protein
VDPFAPESRRPRPVAGLPAVDARAIAKRWLLELVAAAPLEAAAALPTGDVAREGPGLASAVVEALGDDAALGRLAPGGNLSWMAARAAALAGAAEAGGAVEAAEALRRAGGASLHAAGRIDPLTAAELADRLAHVCSLVAAAAVGELAGPVVTPVPAAAPVAGPVVTPQAPRADPRPEPVHTPEHDGTNVVDLRRVSDPIEALRARGDRRPEAGGWQPSVERQLERHRHDGSPFALLAVEVDGLDRLLPAQAEGEVDEELDRLERALAAELRPADQLLREERGRYWVTAPDTGPAVARLLAQRIAEAAGGAARHHGVALTVSIGVATCPDDGEDAETLAGHADQGMFAARAAGTPVA